MKKIFAIIQAIIMVTKILKFLKEEDEGEQVILHPRRLKTKGIDIEKQHIRVEEFKVAVYEFHSNTDRTEKESGVYDLEEIEQNRILASKSYVFSLINKEGAVSKGIN
jgi:hypothetical protein